MFIENNFTCFIISTRREEQPMEKAFFIKEIAEITGKSDTTIYRYLKKGKIPFFTIEKDGQTIYKVKKADLESFLGHPLKEDEKPFPHHEKPVTQNEETVFHSEKTDTQNEKPFFHLTPETLQDAIFQAITKQQSQLMKPIEDQALYRLGRIEQENSFLKAKVETLLQEIDQYKALPMPVDQVKEKLQGQEEQIHSMEEAHRRELQQVKKEAEDEQKNYLATIEELKNRLQAEEKKPWYRKLFS